MKDHEDNRGYLYTAHCGDSGFQSEAEKTYIAAVLETVQQQEIAVFRIAARKGGKGYIRRFP